MNDLFSETKEEVRVVLESRDANDFVVTRTDPFGHWAISREKGLIPECLRGLYTTQRSAIAAIKDYIHSFSLPKKIREIKIRE